MQEDARRVNSAVLKTLSAVNILTMPIGFGVAAISVPLTLIVLGDKWIQAASFVAIFAIISTFQFVTSPLITLLILNGYTKIQNTATWIEFLLFAVAAYILLPYFDLIGLAIARLFASVISAGLILYFSNKYCFTNIYSMLSSIFRPMIGSLLMGVGVNYLLNRLSDGSYVYLAIAIFIGAGFYFFWCLLTWLMLGKPEGLESTVLDNYKAKYKK